MKIKLFRFLCLILLIVGFSFNLKVKAYYSINRNQSVSFTTATYTALSLTTDRNTYGMCNRDATVTLTINNSNSYNVNYTISINDSNLTYTVDGSSSSSYTITKNGTNTHMIVLKGTTTNTSVSIIVTPTDPYSSSHIKSINLDLVCPVCTWETSSTNSIKNGDTFIYNLSCTDASGIATSTLTSNSFTISNSNILSIANITSTSITNGYKYGLTVTGGSTNGNATISVKAGSVADNNSNTNASVTSSNINVNNNVTVNFDYNYNIYDENTSKWTFQGQSKVDSSNQYNGKTGVAVYSNESQWTGIKIPIMSANAKKNTSYLLSAQGKLGSTLSGNLRLYAPTYNSSGTVISYNHGINWTASNTTTSAWKYFGYKFNSGDYYTFPTIYLDYDTASQGPTYISDLRLREYATDTKQYKTAYGTLPTSTRTGYTFAGWYTSATGGTVVSSTTIVTNSSAHTLYAHWSDIEAPVCTFGSFDKESLSVGETTNIKLTCTDNVGVITTSLTSNSFTISNSNAISISNITSASITNGVEYTITVTGGSVTGDSTISLNAGSVKDAASNSNAAVTSISITNIADQTGPEISFDPNGNMTYSKSQSTKVTVTDTSGVASAKYLWTQTKGASAANGTSFTSDSAITKNSGDGLWYLCVYATDNYGNATNECSDAFALDNTPPVITASDICILKGQTLVISNYASASDANGVNSLTAPSFSTDGVTTGTITITATDNAGNTATKTVTVRVFTKLIDRDLVTTGDGLYADSQTAGRYYYKGATPSNYLTFNGETWRILSVEADGSVKIILNTPYTSAAFHSANSGLTDFTSVAAYASLVDYYNNTLTTESKKYLTSHVSYSGVVSYGASSTNTIADTVNAEKGATITTNIALPSITDYLRASNNCNDSTTWKSINNSPFACKTNNWMYNSSTTYWFLNAYSATRARYQNTSGAVSLYTVSDLRGYRPVVYLKATTTFQGSGTSDSPYTICTDCSSSGVSSTTCTVTTASGYDTSKTITITPSSTTGITYSWDGVTWTSSPSKTVTVAGTYNGWIKDSTGKTNGCSISILSRTEYRMASCTAKYGSWSKGAEQCFAEIQNDKMSCTKDWAESNGATYYWLCGASSNCEYNEGTINGCYKYTRSCTSINCGEFGAWQAEKIGIVCGRKVETRTAIGE